jgi:hypothetical protein
MKAILLNSAEKLADNGDGLNLGMTRTLLDESNQPWTAADAYQSRAIPLHKELGTGHLNVYRAYQQLLPGAFGPDTAIPAIGWNYSVLDNPAGDPATTNGGQVHDYVFADPLVAGSYLSATLTWERLVELVDANDNGLYDLGETFNDQGLNNVDLFLMRAEEDDIANSVWSSESEVDSLEHIFYQIPETGRYKLRVIYQQQVHDELTQPYALAWWAVPAP